MNINKKRKYHKVNGKVHEIIETNDDQIGQISEELPYIELIDVPKTEQMTFTGDKFKPVSKCEKCKKRVFCEVLLRNDTEETLCCLCFNDGHIPKEQWEHYPEMFCETCWKLFSKKDYKTTLNNYGNPKGDR